MNNGEAGGGVHEDTARYKNNLIINYLPQTFTDDEFTAMFSSVGPVKNCKIMRNKQTNYSYGYGFVEYIDPNDAEHAINQLNGMQIQHKNIKVSYARRPDQDIKESNLYIQNLPEHADESFLDQMFSPFGEIVQKRVLLDKNTGLPRGVAFVRFSRRSEAQAAIAALNNKVPDGGTKQVIVMVAKDFSSGGQAQFSRGAGRGGRGGARGRGAGRGAFSHRGGYTGGYNPSQPAGAYANNYTPGYAGYDAGYQDYSGGYGDYSGGYGDYGTADAPGPAVGGYGDYAAAMAAAAGRGQQRRGGRGFNKTMPFKSNNRFNPMGSGF